MSEAYARERLWLFDALLKKKLDVINGKLWAIEPRHMRFKLGESIAELKVPYHMGADDESCIENSVLTLLSLIMKRFEAASAAVPEGQEGAQQAPPVNIPALKDRTYRTDLFITGSLEKRLAEEILCSAPYMDSSILLNWFGADGQGRKLIKWVSDIFEKTLKEEARCAGEEKTSYLALLAILNTFKKKKERIKGYRIKGLTYEKIDLAIGMTLFLTVRGALKETMARLRASRASYYNHPADLLLNSAVVPRHFVSIPSAIISTNLNPYCINSEIYTLLAPFAEEIRPETGSLDEVITATIDRLRPNNEAAAALKQHYNIIRFRQEALNYLMEFDLPGNAGRDIILSVYSEDRHIKSFIADHKAVAGLIAILEETKKKFLKDEARSEMISSFLDYLYSFKKSVFRGFLKTIKKEDIEPLEDLVCGFYAFRLDERAEKFSSITRSYLADRRGEYSSNMVLEEYNRGRLYRFSTDERPFLKTLALEEEGQLFIDMKDFTRKTLKVKEIAMAEFMKEYFYQPILNAASNYKVGTGVVADERGIRLTNLPGDAAIFSGGVSYLVSLARDIQRIIKDYRDQLLKRLPPAKDEAMLEEVHKRFEARKGELKLKRAELNAALQRNEHVESKLVALGEEEHRLENSYRDELEAAIQGELEAGLYISYGAKAEEMVIEAHEEFTEPVRVSIGEKINEAARGTNRNPLVRTKLEMLIENENQRKKTAKKYPFDVYVDRTYSVRMPPELDGAFEKLVSKRTPVTAQAMSQVMAGEFLNDLKKIVAGDAFTTLRLISASTDIYNKGQSLSEAALNAYMRENRGTRKFFKKVIPVGELDESIREAFFFPSSPLEFWFGIGVFKGTEQIESFYRCGEIIFKGFEASTPVAVYEILNSDGDFFKALTRLHIHKWAEEAKAAERVEAAKNSI